MPRECSDIQGQHPDGVYTIYPDGISPVSVFCDMHTENGKWTVQFYLSIYSNEEIKIKIKIKFKIKSPYALHEKTNQH